MGSNWFAATHWGDVTLPKNPSWNLRDSPNVQVFIKTYKSQNWLTYIASRKTTGQKILDKRRCRWEHIRNWGNMFRGETESVMGTYVELKENNKKIEHHPTTPKKKKVWTPWMHSRLVSLAAKNLYASFIFFTINARGITWRDVVSMAQMFCCGTDDWGW